LTISALLECLHKIIDRLSHFPTIKERNCIEIALISINLNFFGYNRDILNTFNANNFTILYSKESRM
uniref:hypothetical protein n=1 Tax=Streptococcus agalactiae TaxID=1311 RepID=UPI001C407A56